MTIPTETGNAVPRNCRCWMVRGADLAYREICDAFSPNPMATLRLDADRSVELCEECDHPEACHPPAPTSE